MLRNLNSNNGFLKKFKERKLKKVMINLLIKNMGKLLLLIKNKKQINFNLINLW